MRRTALLLATALLAGLAVVAVPTPDITEAAPPPACPFANSSQRYCNRYTGDNTLRSIGLIGDSVLLGSADGFSNPGLPKMLSDQGWGPINLIATLGMRVSSTNNDISANYWVDRWQANGFNPEVIVVNLGANLMGAWNAPYCTPTNPANCKAQIDSLLDNIGPNTLVWWAKVNHEPFGKGNGYSLGMLGWNAALDQAALQRSNLMLWDWPTALATANPAILMDTARIHPSSGAQYVKRSTLMATHITTHMAPARYLGPRATLPAGDGSGYGYSPVAPVTIYSTPTDGPRFAASEVRTIDLSGVAAVDDAATALALTVSSSNPAADGWLTLWRCGDPMPPTSNVNFTAGAFRTAQVVTRITAAGELCVQSSVATDVVISLQGNFLSGSGTGLNPIAPVRPLDTRATGRAQNLVITVPGTGVLAAAVTVTATGNSTGGTIALYACDAPMSTVANVSFLANETVASAAYVPVAANGTVCARVETGNTQYTDVIVDVTGVFRTGSGLLFVPAPGARILDTRNAIGGWVYRQRFLQTIDTVGAPAGAKAVTGTITIVRPQFRGFLTAHACGQALPPTSSVNANAGLVMANSITVGVEPTQRTLCIYSSRNTNTLFDVVGWWVEAT